MQQRRSTNFSTALKVSRLLLGVASVGVLAVQSADAQTVLTPKAVYEGLTSPFSEAISPDGSIIALPAPGAIKLISAKTGSTLKFIAADTFSITNALAFTPDGRRIIAAGAKYQLGAPNNGILQVLDVATGKLLANLPTSAGFVLRSISVSPDGRTLVSGGADRNSTTQIPSGILEIWNLSTYKLSTTLPTGAVYSVNSTALSADGSKLAVGGENASTTAGGVVELWDLKSKKRVQTYPTQATEYIVSVALSADGKYLAGGGSSYQASSGTTAGTLEIWNTISGKLLAELPTQQTFGVEGIRFSPNSKILADCGNTQGAPIGVETWDTSTLKPLGNLNVSGLGTSCIAFFPQGSSLCVGVQGTLSGVHVGGVEIWSTKTWALSGQFTQDSSQRFASSVPIPGSNQILFAGQTSASGKSLGQFGTWDITQQTLSLLPTSLAVAGGGASCVAVTRDGTLGAVSGQVGTNGIIELWDLKARKLVATLPTSATAETGLSFSTDSSTLASTGRNGSGGGVLEIWSASSHKLIGSLSRPSPLVSVAFAPNGQQVAAGETTTNSPFGGTGDVLVADVSTLSVRNIIGGSATTVVSHLTYSPDGLTLGAGGYYTDSTTGNSVIAVQLWNPSTGASIGNLALPNSGAALSQIAFSPDGGTLFTASGGFTLSNYLQAFDSSSLKLKASYSLPQVISMNSIGFASSGKDLFLGCSVPLFVTENAFYTPFAFGGFSVNPPKVPDGSIATASVTLVEPAPPGGITVLLKSDKSAARVPAQIHIPAGSRVGTFTVHTSQVPNVVIATLTATIGKISTTAQLQINPVPPPSTGH